MSYSRSYLLCTHSKEVGPISGIMHSLPHPLHLTLLIVGFWQFTITNNTKHPALIEVWGYYLAKINNKHAFMTCHNINWPVLVKVKQSAYISVSLWKMCSLTESDLNLHEQKYNWAIERLTLQLFQCKKQNRDTESSCAVVKYKSEWIEGREVYVQCHLNVCRYVSMVEGDWVRRYWIIYNICSWASE